MKLTSFPNATRWMAPLVASALLGLPGAALAAGSVPTATSSMAATTTPTTTTPTPTTTTPTPTTTTPTPTTTAPTPTKPKPKPKPIKAPVPKPVSVRPSLAVSGLFSVHHSPVTVEGHAFTVAGTIRPYVAGQKVLLKGFVGGHVFTTTVLRLQPLDDHRAGGFTLKLSSAHPGNVSLLVEHTRNAKMTGFEVRQSFAVLDEHVGFGSTGRFVELLQQRLSALHFYIPQTGVYDTGTGLAVDAYHRLLGWGFAQTLGPALVNDLLGGVGSFHVRFPGQGSHAEGDLSDQLLALVNGGKVYWIFPISSGKPSTPTVLGSWRIYRRTPGYLSDGMYYSSFFISGYAIHGYDPAPDYPASHGCMRLPIVDAIPAFNWLNYNEWVDTYYT